MATRAPSLSNSCAAANPIPLLPPVIRIFLFASLPIVVSPMMFFHAVSLAMSSSLLVPWAVRCLHLCEAAVHKQFRARDVARVVGGEKHHGLRDLIGCTAPAQRNTVRNHLEELLARCCGSQVIHRGRVDEAWAHRVHANAAILQVRCPGPRERAHGGFRGASDASRRRPFASADGRIQDDRGAIRKQRKCLLHRKKQASHMDVEERIIVLLSYLAQRGKLRNTGIREHDIELALLSLDLSEETIKIAQVRHVSWDVGHISSDLLGRRSQLRMTAPRDEDVRAFVHKLLRSRQANAAAAASNDGDFSLKLPHVFLLGCQAMALRCCTAARMASRSRKSPNMTSAPSSWSRFDRASSRWASARTWRPHASNCSTV